MDGSMNELGGNKGVQGWTAVAVSDGDTVVIEWDTVVGCGRGARWMTLIEWIWLCDSKP